MVNVAGSRLVLSLKAHARDMQLARSGSSLGQSRYSLRFKQSQSSETDESIFTRLPPRSKRHWRPRLLSFPLPPNSVPFPPGLSRPLSSAHPRMYSYSHAPRHDSTFTSFSSPTASSHNQSSSSFVVGRDTYLDFDDYIKLHELHSGSGYGSGTDSNTARSESYPLGTVYPEKYQSHWEAI